MALQTAYPAAPRPSALHNTRPEIRHVLKHHLHSSWQPTSAPSLRHPGGHEIQEAAGRLLPRPGNVQCFQPSATRPAALAVGDLRSTRMTSAPISANIMPAHGPGPMPAMLYNFYARQRSHFEPSGQHAAADQLLHDLTGAAVDTLHPGIDESAGYTVFAHVAITAVQLQTGICHPTLHLCSRTPWPC